MTDEMSVSEMMQEGTLCESCGVYDDWGVGDQFPRICSDCAKRNFKGHQLRKLSIGGYQHVCEAGKCPRGDTTMTDQIDELITFPVRYSNRTGGIYDVSGVSVVKLSQFAAFSANAATYDQIGQFIAEALNEKYERGRIPVTDEDFERAGYEDIGGGV